MIRLLVTTLEKFAWYNYISGQRCSMPYISSPAQGIQEISNKILEPMIPRPSVTAASPGRQSFLQEACGMGQLWANAC